MGRARLPSAYAKVQLGLHALALGAALATIGAALFVTSQGYGFGSMVALAIVVPAFVLALDISEIMALADSTGRRKRLPAVHLTVTELVAAALSFLWIFIAPYMNKAAIPGCNMDAPIKDCVDHVDLLRRVNRGSSLTFLLSWGLGALHAIFLVFAIVELFRRRRGSGRRAASQKT